MEKCDLQQKVRAKGDISVLGSVNFKNMSLLGFEIEESSMGMELQSPKIYGNVTARS